jgi:hypothetical protein
MKKIFTIMLFMVLSTVLFAQQNYQDVVYLKNGSIIRGLIIEQVPNQSIKIETMDKSVFVYKIEEVEKITKEQRKAKVNRQSSTIQPGYQGIVEIGYGLKTGDYGMNLLKLNVINGYRINDNLAIGLGTGIRHYTESGESGTLVPVFADFRGYLIQNNISPYVALGIGYTFDASNSFSGVGVMVNPSVGVGFKMQNNSLLHVGIGYEIQKADAINYYFDGNNNNYFYSKETIGAISLNVGITF